MLQLTQGNDKDWSYFINIMGPAAWSIFQATASVATTTVAPTASSSASTGGPIPTSSATQSPTPSYS
jgi:hypothetical protein